MITKSNTNESLTQDVGFNIVVDCTPRPCSGHSSPIETETISYSDRHPPVKLPVFKIQSITLVTVR